MRRRGRAREARRGEARREGLGPPSRGGTGLCSWARRQEGTVRGGLGLGWPAAARGRLGSEREKKILRGKGGVWSAEWRGRRRRKSPSGLGLNLGPNGQKLTN